MAVIWGLVGSKSIVIRISDTYDFYIYKWPVCPPLLPVKSPKVFPERNILFLTKFKMAAKRHVEVVIPELFNIYFNVIPHAELISEAISNFQGFVKE